MSSKFKWYGPEVVKKLAQANEAGLTACAMTLQGQARELTPVITGRLRDSIIYKTNKSNGKMESRAQSEDEIKTKPQDGEAIIGTNVFYAPYVELGAGGRQPKSFLRRALDETRNKLFNIFEKEYNRIMK